MEAQIMSTRVIPWTIEISNLATKLRVGIWDHEREFQPICIDLSIRAITSAFPQSIEDCLDYQPICHWITDEWPKQAHTPLLETKLCELMHFVFAFDARIEWIDAAISKPNAIAEARGVGVRMAIARGDHELTFGFQESFVNKNISYCNSVVSHTFSRQKFVS
jgi:7,8-dihydroneopterin aldolase/epimerase/oxygenase